MKNLEKTCWTISDLIVALLSFRNPDLEVRLSVDDGKTTRPISYIVSNDAVCLFGFDLQAWQRYFSPEDGTINADCPDEVYFGKKIPQLVNALRVLDALNHIAVISVDGSESMYQVNRIERREVYCILVSNPSGMLACKK